MKRIQSIILGTCTLAVASAMTSCIEDESVYAGAELPGITVPVPADGSLPEVNFNYGDECVIDPKVNYQGSGELTYEWSIGTYTEGIKGALEVVSNEPVLRYSFPMGGTYYAHLDVTDGKVGIVQDYLVNINRTFEQGYMIVSTDKSGNGNLAFIKDRTPEEVEAGTPAVVMENCLERFNIGLTPEPIVDAYILKLTYPVMVNRLVVSTASKSLFLDMTSLTSISTIEYDPIIPGFKSNINIGSSTNITAYDKVSKKGIVLDGNNMFGYESAPYDEVDFDAVYSGNYEAYGVVNFVTAYVKYNPLRIYANSPYVGWISTSDAGWQGTPGDDLYANEEFLDYFIGEKIMEYDPVYDYSYSVYPVYILTRDKSTGKVYNNYLSGFGGYDMEVEIKARAECPTTADTAVPGKDVSIVPSATYHRTYYSVENNVYAMLKEGDAFIFPNKNQYCISYPGEEVTYITLRAATNELVVATCTTSTGRGNVYIYDVKDVRTDNPNPEPKATFKNCADRITKIFYKARN